MFILSMSLISKAFQPDRVLAIDRMVTADVAKRWLFSKGRSHSYFGG
jgi:hypothetical protein